MVRMYYNSEPVKAHTLEHLIVFIVKRQNVHTVFPDT